MLAQISANRQSLALISITRDSWVDIPGYGPGKINSAFARGGTELMRQTVSQMFGGLQIDFVVQTDFEGFIGITRALDGFTVDVRFPTSVTVQSTGRVVEFGAGPIELEATDGLIDVRQRYGLPQGDLDRTERQRAAIIGILDRLDAIATDPVALGIAMTHIASRVKITGDRSVDDMIALVSLSQQLEQDDVVSRMAPISGFGTQAGQSVNVVDVAQTAALGEALRAGALADSVAAYGTGY